MKSLIHVFAFAFFCTLVHCHGQGTLIVGHLGSADPTSEGFSLMRGGNPSLAPVTGDFGMNAWCITLNSLNDIALYSRSLTAQQQADAASAGWIMSLTLRILAPVGSAEGNFVSFSTGSKLFSLRLGAQPNGDPIVSLIGGPSYILDGAGSGYHNYQVRYDSGSGIASFWFDGTKIADTLGTPNANPAGFGWGGGQNTVGIVSAYWNEASLTIVPEPSMLALVGLGGFVFALRLLRSRRSKR